ncbi:Tat pathway signal protein [Brevundimonas sp.]|uniref:Tat pathway signal protein n=1 Tax=Brevundimonas sp. TaxID=1871086 RepID=UPI00356690B9
MSNPHTDRIVPALGQQMDRSNDPDTTRQMDAAAPEAALASRRQRLTGSAVGVGSVGFDEDGAFGVGADDHEPQDNAITDTPKP